MSGLRMSSIRLMDCYLEKRCERYRAHIVSYKYMINDLSNLMMVVYDSVMTY